MTAKASRGTMAPTERYRLQRGAPLETNRYVREVLKEKGAEVKIAVAFKVVPDDQDIQVASVGTLDFSKATGTLAALDTAGTAEELAAIVGEGGFDLILCGDGSADEYAQQVDVQLAARRGGPSVNAVTAIKAEGDSMVVERTLEDVVEEVEVPLPAVIAVTPDVATPRIPGMKDILAAGKKPMDVKGAPVAPVSAVEVVSCAAPEAAERACNVADASADGAIEAFAAALKAAL